MSSINSVMDYGDVEPTAIRKQRAAAMLHSPVGLCASIFGRAFAAVLDPQPQFKSGRVVQFCWIALFSGLLVAGIVVMVMTDIELTTDRNNEERDIYSEHKIVLEMLTVVQLLAAGMEPNYDYNEGPYDIFVEKAQSSFLALDTKLTFSETWLEPRDFIELTSEQSVNITNANALKAAVRNLREARKAPNGTDENEIMTFYSDTFDFLLTSSRTVIARSQRFTGWQDFLGIACAYRFWMNFKKFALVGKRLARENRSVSVQTSPPFRSLLLYYNSYVELVSIVSLMSPFGKEKLMNLSTSDTQKEVERYYTIMLGGDFSKIDHEAFGAVAAAHDPSIAWVLGQMKYRVNYEMVAFAGNWDSTDIISTILMSLSVGIVAVAFLAHLWGTYRMQRQIISYHENLRTLQECLTLLYDFVPRTYISTARTGEISPVKLYKDAAVLIMDIYNFENLMINLESPQFVELLQDYFEIIESLLVKFTCFKVAIVGNSFMFGAGIGEHHAFDHVLELILLGLELRDIISERNAKDKTDKADADIRIRLGLHCGPCHSRVVYLQVPRMLMTGDLTQIANRLLVSQSVYDRLDGASTEISFYQRGKINFGDMKLRNESYRQMETYWCEWSQNGPEDDRSVASTVTDLRGRRININAD